MKVPRHLAIIMDGNGRWAKKRNLPRILGHRSGIKTVDIVAEECARLGIKALTLYTFSSENWSRPKQEVDALMGLLHDNIKKYGKKLTSNNIKFNTIGNTNELSLSLRDAISDLKKKTSNNTGMVLTLALNYGGRKEIIDAVNSFLAASSGADSVREQDLEEHLYTSGLPELDLIIRTSGEKRISNFLLWQSAYSEFYFTDTLWPDFGAKDLEKALLAFSKRERRFGG